MMTSSPPLLPQHLPRTTAKIDFIVDLPNDSDTTTTTTTKTTTVIAFGSCHKNKYSHPQIWKSIRNENPISFLWTGDAIYPPIRNIAPLSYLQEEYTQMKYNHTIGYTQILSHHNNNNDNHIPIFGTWDDHDYGGNDRGNDMTQRMERARLFYQFINQSIPLDDDVDDSADDSHNSGDNNNENENTNTEQPRKKEREGIYYSVEFRHRSSASSTNTHDGVMMDESTTLTTQTVRVLFLDTRYFRTSHCLPSLAGQFPLGAGIACLSRWFSAGMLQQYCTSQHSSSSSKSTILGTTQWEWLRQQIYNVPPPDILIVVSSIQVYTTNPAMEGWGHYPNELRQLSELLLYASRRSVVTILSGDVHHGEILTPVPPVLNTPRNNYIHASTPTTSEQPYYLEVTSSGLTHDCSKHIYGIVCEPLLRTFHQHRYQNMNNYYIGRNYGTISIDWMNQNVSINVHDAMTGTIQLSTGSRPFITNPIDSSLNKAKNTDDDTNETLLLLNSIIPCMDNHLVPYVYRSCMIIVLLVTMMLYSFRIRSTGKRTSLDNNVGDKKKKS